MTTTPDRAAFDTVLVANRGEIAARIIRSARDMGLRTVAVYSDADADAAHLHGADVRMRIGPAEARLSYLDIDAILAAAKLSGAQAVHPGYGFLSENAEFARRCDQAGITFVGPSPEAIDAMGDKALAKNRLANSAVPMMAGYQGADCSDERLVAEADRIGYPLMVKAAAGGGGKGMRLVNEPAALAAALATARREAQSAFGSSTLILERAAIGARHVEVQILADAYGNVVHLGERDCSTQRRHQKVIEEAPCAVLDSGRRSAMGAAAVAAATAINYTGAGTVEFLLCADGTFAFLEMNTRLQVEHPVTELVTGLDLVQWQLRIAAGDRIDFTTDDITHTGHAIEARLYAEDPAAGFLPSAGTVLAWGPPSGAGIRVDSGIVTGSEITPFYDPMLAKIISHGGTREQARRRLIAALSNTVLLGVRTNRAYLIDILASQQFGAAEVTTDYLDAAGPAARGEPAAEHVAAAAAWLHTQRTEAAERRSPRLAGWSNSAVRLSHQRLSDGERSWPILIRRDRQRTAIILDSGEEADVADILDSSGICAVADGPNRVLAQFGNADLAVTDTLSAPPDRDPVPDGVPVALMHGTVTVVHVSRGQRVQVGEQLVVMEAMKLEHVVCATRAGIVTDVVSAGQHVAAGQVLVGIEARTTYRNS